MQRVYEMTEVRGIKKTHKTGSISTENLQKKKRK